MAFSHVVFPVPRGPNSSTLLVGFVGSLSSRWYIILSIKYLNRVSRDDQYRFVNLAPRMPKTLRIWHARCQKVDFTGFYGFGVFFCLAIGKRAHSAYQHLYCPALFILMALQEVALQVLGDHEVIMLSTQDQAAFVKALLAPPKPRKKLILAAERYKKNVVSR